MTLQEIVFAPESAWDTLNYFAHKEIAMFIHIHG